MELSQDEVGDVIEEHMTQEYMLEATRNLKELLDVVPDIGVKERTQFIDCYFRNIWSVVFNKRLIKIEKNVQSLMNEKRSALKNPQFASALFFQHREHLLDAVLKAEEEREELN